MRVVIFWTMCHIFAFSRGLLGHSLLTEKLAVFPVISGTNDKYMIITDLIGMEKIVDFACFSINEIIQAILGPWREGVPANRATRLLTLIKNWVIV